MKQLLRGGEAAFFIEFVCRLAVYRYRTGKTLLYKRKCAGIYSIKFQHISLCVCVFSIDCLFCSEE